VVQRWIAGISAGDGDAVFARLSEHPGTLFIGTDPNEWWHGEEMRAVLGRQLEEVSPHPITFGEGDAWEEGSFGWASGRLMIDWVGRSHEARFTCVLRLERGDSKVVQYQQVLVVRSPAHRRSSKGSKAPSPTLHRRSESGSASTPVTLSRRPNTSSAPLCTMPRVSPATPSAAKCSFPALYTTSSPAAPRTSPSSKAARSN
jgi:hypothetical protein